MSSSGIDRLIEPKEMTSIITFKTFLRNRQSLAILFLYVRRRVIEITGFIIPDFRLLFFQLGVKSPLVLFERHIRKKRTQQLFQE